MFSEQLWRYDGKTKKLKNRIGSWKYETNKRYQNQTRSRSRVDNYCTLQNDYGRFLIAEPQSALEANRSYSGQ